MPLPSSTGHSESLSLSSVVFVPSWLFAIQLSEGLGHLGRTRSRKKTGSLGTVYSGVNRNCNHVGQFLSLQLTSPEKK